MKQVTTVVGIDAHKKDLFVAMLSGPAAVPVTWQLWTLKNAPTAAWKTTEPFSTATTGP